MFLYFSRDTDCLKIWESLKYAFIYKNPCNTTAEDYQPLMELASHPIPCNKVRTWLWAGYTRGIAVKQHSCPVF